MMEHIIYKTTNLINKRFYIGMHSTKNINDGYLGSGKRIRVEVKKYGKENFIKEILEYLPTRDALAKREAEIVNEQLLNDPLCLNLVNGGGEGWSIVHKTRANLNSPKFQEYKNSGRLAANFAACAKFRTKQSLAECTKRSWKNPTEAMIKRMKAGLEAMNTVAAKEKRKVTYAERGHAQGEKNSQFGTCWVTNGTSIKIKKEQLDEYLANGYKRGRK